MTLTEAIKSGKWFKRKSVPSDWYGTDGSRVVYQPQFKETAFCAHLGIADLLADDWILKEVSITITPTDFWNAYAKANCRYHSRKVLRGEFVLQDLHEVMDYLAQELGIREKRGED